MHILVDAEHVQGRSSFYQQRSATLNHNGSGQYSSNATWHRQSSVDLTPQHQGIINIFDKMLYSYLCASQRSLSH